MTASLLELFIAAKKMEPTDNKIHPFLCPETDIMNQFLGPKTDVTDEKHFMGIPDPLIIRLRPPNE